MLSHKHKNSSPAVSASEGQEDPPPDSFVLSWGEPSTKDKQGEVKQTGKFGSLRYLPKGNVTAGDLFARFRFLFSPLNSCNGRRPPSCGQWSRLGLSHRAWSGW